MTSEVVVKENHMMIVHNCCFISLHAERGNEEIKDDTSCDHIVEAFNADHVKLVESLQPSTTKKLHDLSAAELLHSSADFICADPPTSICAKIIVVQCFGKVKKSTLYFRCADGQWISVIKFAKELSESSPRKPIVVLVHAVELNNALPANLCCELSLSSRMENILLFWDICPLHKNFFDRDGSLYVQIIANQFQSRAENSTLQEIFLCSRDIADWYVASKQDCRLVGSIAEELCAPCSRLIGDLPPCRLELWARVFQPSFAPTGNTLIDNHGALILSSQWQTCSIHTHAVKVTITSRTDGAEIFYTMDGTIPTRESKRYKKPVLLAHDGVGFEEFIIKAVGFKDGMQPSRIGVSPLYRVQAQTRPVVFSEIRSGDEVLLNMCSETPRALIFFEAGEQELTGNSTLYQGPIRLHTKMIRAFARVQGMTDSVVTTFELKAQAEVPSITGTGDLRLSSELDENRRQVFLNQVTVEMRSNAVGAEGCRYYYHIRTESSAHAPALPRKETEKGGYGACLTRYLGPVVLKAVGVHRVTAYAVADGAADSDLAEAVLEVQQQVDPVQVTPASGSFKLSVAISARSDTSDSGVVADGRHLLPKTGPAAHSAGLSLPAVAAAVGAGPSGCVVRRGLVLKPSGGLDLTLDRRDDALFGPDGLLAGKPRLRRVAF
jgi:hypothetical protein